MQSQGLTVPPEPEVGPSAACVSTKESCVDHSGKNSDTGERVLVVVNMEMLFFHVNWAVEPRALMSHMGMLLEAG